MSRIGRIPVVLPAKVKAEIKPGLVNIEGPKGKLSQSFPEEVTIALDNNSLVVKQAGDSRFAKSMYGTLRSLLANMVKGVTEGYQKDLEIQGVGFKATLQGKVLDLALGYSHQIKYAIPEGVKVTTSVDENTKNTKVKIEGCDKRLVGKVATEIRSFYPPEPYKGKGVRIVGERVRRKEGKTVA
jgi:large subunit ribosomal protein L6